MYDMSYIYHEYSQAVYKYLLSLRCDFETAEDLVQETFCQAIKSIERYDGSCKMSVWLCQIAKHLWYRELSRRSKDKESELTADIADRKMSVIEEVIENEQHEKLKLIISQLPDISQQVVNFRIYNNMSFREIGLVLGKTENWARVTYYRCKGKIVERWKQNEA